MSNFDEINKKLLIENSKMRRIIDEVDILHYKSLNEELAEIKNQELLAENKKLREALLDIYDL